MQELRGNLVAEHPAWWKPALWELAMSQRLQARRINEKRKFGEIWEVNENEGLGRRTS